MALNPVTRRLPGGRIVLNHGEHDQKTHGNRGGGTATAPARKGTRVVGGLELRTGDDESRRADSDEEFQRVDSKKLTGDISYSYPAPAVRMRDGSVHASADGHANAMVAMLKKGYSRSDFQSVGFFHSGSKTFEPYHVDDLGHIRYMMDHAVDHVKSVTEFGWSLDKHATQHGDHDQKTHGNRDGAGERDESMLVRVDGIELRSGDYDARRPVVIEVDFNNVRESGGEESDKPEAVLMQDGTLFTGGSHVEAFAEAFRSGYGMKDVRSVGHYHSGWFARRKGGKYNFEPLGARSIGHIKAQARAGLDMVRRAGGGDSKEGWSLDHLEHDQKTHGNRDGGGVNIVEKGGLEFTKAEARTYRFPGTGQKIDAKDVVGTSSGIYPAAVRMRDGSLILGSSHYSIFTGAVFGKGYKKADVRSYGYYNREDGEFFPLLADDSAHAGSVIDDAWKDHQRTEEGFSLDTRVKRIWPLRATHHGEHDQKTHGNRGGGLGDRAKWERVGGINLAKADDTGGMLVPTFVAVDPKNVVGRSSYPAGAAVVMKDGTVYVGDSHVQVFKQTYREGISEDAIESVGEYLSRTKEFSPYTTAAYQHIRGMMAEGKRQAGMSDNPREGWSLDRRHK